MSVRSRTPMLSVGQENSRVARLTATSPTIADAHPAMLGLAMASKRRQADLLLPDRKYIDCRIEIAAPGDPSTSVETDSPSSKWYVACGDEQLGTALSERYCWRRRPGAQIFCGAYVYDRCATLVCSRRPRVRCFRVRKVLAIGSRASRRSMGLAPCPTSAARDATVAALLSLPE